MVHQVWSKICQKAETSISRIWKHISRYLWRVIGQDGEVVNILPQAHRDSNAAKRFFNRFLKKLRNELRKISELDQNISTIKFTLPNAD
ncbi:DDE-type integrase/transposase/recombinase [uncultured Nitrosomonas sp.]|uniref:DDE-type integrase/transposase/recombinase n=1 Tax=uncultured Nitrosomonas sp. TaxID=156424 RepID=UPI0034586309